MDTFIEGLGERYLERKINAAPEQLEKLAKKQFQSKTGNGKVAQTTRNTPISSDGRDEEIERLRKELAAAKLDRSSPKAATRSVHSSGAETPENEARRSHDREDRSLSRATRSVHSSGAETAENEARRSHDREDRDLRRDHDSRPASVSQAELNRLALQHADNDRTPLKASNLERLASQHHILDKGNKHGGSAALLHSSRAHHGQRETLAYSSLDAQGNPCTEAFRPHRSSDLCIVEVVEDEDKPKRSTKVHQVKDTNHKQSDRRTKEVMPARREQEAVQISHAAGRRVYKVR